MKIGRASFMVVSRWWCSQHNVVASRGRFRRVEYRSLHSPCCLDIAIGLLRLPRLSTRIFVALESEWITRHTVEHWKWNRPEPCFWKRDAIVLNIVYRMIWTSSYLLSFMNNNYDRVEWTLNVHTGAFLAGSEDKAMGTHAHASLEPRSKSIRRRGVRFFWIAR